MNHAQEISRWLFDEFSARLASVFEAMAGAPPKIDVEEVSEMPADATLQWRQRFSGIPGAAWVSAAEAAWGGAGGHVLRATGMAQSDRHSLKSTYLEAISQALSGVATALGGRTGHEVHCEGGEESKAARPADTAWAVLHIRLGKESAGIAIGFEPELLAAVEASPIPEDAPARVIEAGGPVVSAEFTAPVNSRTFELLLDVELPVSVSFGRAQVPLKDVLKLTTGSIVELNRSIQEPVEVIVNNCVIARGEVVVVEGNFGVRIHQVVSRQERLRTLN